MRNKKKGKQGCCPDTHAKYFDIIIKIIDEKQKLQVELEKEIKELKKFSKKQIKSIEAEIQKDFENIRNEKIKL